MPQASPRCRRACAARSVLLSVLLSVPLSGLLLLLGSSAAAQDPASAYPNKPITIIVPYAPGGGTDVAARSLAAGLAAKFGWKAVVDNRAGGNTVIGSQAVAKATPDGHTLLLVATTFAINPLLTPNLPYNATRDFAPVSTVAGIPFIMVVHPSVPAGNLREMQAILRAAPAGEWNFGTVGSSGIGRMAGEIFASQAGIKLQHVPYKGASQLVTDLIGGSVKFSIDAASGYPAHLRSGKVKVLAVAGKSRLAILPDVPTFAEQGMDYNVSLWLGLFATGGTPRSVVNKLAQATNEVLALADTREKFAALELTPLGSTPDAFAAQIKTETEAFARIIQSAGIKAE